MKRDYSKTDPTRHAYLYFSHYIRQARHQQARAGARGHARLVARAEEREKWGRKKLRRIIDRRSLFYYPHHFPHISNGFNADPA